MNTLHRTVRRLRFLALVCTVWTAISGTAWAEDAPSDGEEPATIPSVLERMDVELPERLSAEDYQLIAERCASVGEAELASCVVDSDDVVEHYLKIASEKKQLFGKELYVEFAGLLALMPIEVVGAARQACPQPDVEGAAACLVKHEVVGKIIEVYFTLAREIVEESASEAAKAGNQIDVDAYTEKVATLFLTMPSHTILSLAGTCMKKHPELEHAKSAEDIDAALACIAEEAKTDPVANPAYISKEKLNRWLGVARAKVTEVIRTKEESSQSKSFRRILMVILALAGVGYLCILLMPLFLRSRYPGRGGLLWKTSAVSAGAFAITVVLLGGSLYAIRTVQGAVATDSTSPKMRVADAAFAVLSKPETIDALSDLSKERLDFIKAPLRSIINPPAGEDIESQTVFAAFLVTHWISLLDEPELKNLAKNAAMLKSHAQSMKAVFGVYSKVDWIMSIVPLVLSLLAVFLYMMPLKEMLVAIVTAPIRAARSAASADDSATKAMHTLWSEIKSVVPYLGAILLLLPLTGLFLALAVEPLVELLMGYSLMTLFYILFAEASGFVLYLSLGSTMVLLVLCLATYIMTMGAVLGQSRKIFRAIWHHGYRFGDFKRFWLWGAAAVLLLFTLPFLYAYAGLWLAGAMEPGSDGLRAKDMLLVPLPAVLLFPVTFWALRGWKAMTFIKKYPVPKNADGRLEREVL